MLNDINLVEIIDHKIKLLKVGLVWVIAKIITTLKVRPDRASDGRLETF
jgi:hypothetical protein